MKKFLKAIISFVLVVSVVVGTISFSFQNKAYANDDIEYFYFNGHTYAFFEEGLSWTDANERCKELDGHLVTITSYNEQSFLTSVMEEYSLAVLFYFIGGYKESSSSSWRWVTGEPFSYSCWGENQSDKGFASIANFSSEDVTETLDPLLKKLFEEDLKFKMEQFYWHTIDSSLIFQQTLIIEALGGFICEWDYVTGDCSTEDLMFLNNLPVLSPSEAEAFLDFLYNGNLKGIDITQDINYKLLTGSLSGMSTQEIRNLITAFCLIVENKINGYVDDASNHTSYFTDSLIKRLENQLPSGLETIGDEITGAAYELLNDEIGKCLDIGTDKYTLLDAATGLNGITVMATIPEKVLQFCEGVSIAVDAINLVNSSDRLGRYGYFNAYLDCLNFSGDEFEFYSEMQFIIHTDNTIASQLKKDVWTDDREEIEKWAEYIYELGQYQYSSEHRYIDTVVSPTCSSRGYINHECTYCGDTYRDNYKNSLGHKYRKTNFKPTCTSEGYDLYSCSRCDEYYKSNITPATGHIKYTVKTTMPTCIQGGYDLYTCACGVSWKENITGAVGHLYISTVIEPTETKQGYTINECSNCRNIYYSEYTNPTGHEFSTTVVLPACESDGYTKHICNGCGYEYNDNYVLAIGHTYSLISETWDTCTEDGLREYACDNCGSTYNESISALGHNYEYMTETIEATCDEEGYTIHTCECGDTYIDGYIDALGHDYAIIETVEATCTENGHIKYECSICNSIYCEIIYAPENGHIFKITETVAGDCTHCGYNLSKCTVCGVGKYEDIVVAVGHTLGGWQETIPATEQIDGKKERHCNNCDYFETALIQKLPPKGHKIVTIDYFLQIIFDRIFEFLRRVF